MCMHVPVVFHISVHTLHTCMHMCVCTYPHTTHTHTHTHTHTVVQCMHMNDNTPIMVVSNIEKCINGF